MRTRKTMTAVAACMLASVIFAFPASAHGHGHHRRTTDNYVHVCTIEGCTETGRHLHDGVSYCGYSHSSGYCDGSCARTEGSGYGGHHCR